ncbi:MAG: peptidylprolyl isomerase [Phycisphaerae bacterium]|nr:peptidylprolyl isomerase [Phycisphaerae bacterium]
MNIKSFFGSISLLCLLWMSTSAPLLADRTVVEMQTSAGDITIELYDNDTPVTVANFLDYIAEDFYDGLIFHRVIDNFMVQGGAYDPNLYEADFTDEDFSIRDPNFFHTPKEDIPDEVDTGLLNDWATLAMANAGAGTGNSQFFINQNPSGNHHLDGKHTVFGLVVDGMDVVDAIASVQKVDNADMTAHFADLPLIPVTIDDLSIVRQFNSESSDFSSVPFLNASDGTVRTYVGQGAQDGESYRHVFTTTEFLGVDCLQWRQVSDSNSGLDDFTLLMARDADGQMWVFKYVLNEDTDLEEIELEATTLSEGVMFNDFAADHMQFRLITSLYNPDDLGSPDNSLTTGSGVSQVTEKIVDVAASLLPNYPDADVIIVKRYVGPEGSESDIDWLYYHQGVGLILNLEDDAQDTTSDGWQLSSVNFDSDSDDFSQVDFLSVPRGKSLIRTYVGQGIYEGQNYTQTFAFPTTPFSGVRYMKWVQNADDIDEVDSFTLQLLRDISGEIWVITYILNGETKMDAATLLEVEPLNTVVANDNIQFHLIEGLYNTQDLTDPINTFVRGTGSDAITEKVVSSTSSVGHIPYYKEELFETKTWQGVVENANNVSYFHDSAGLILNLRHGADGADGADGDGWHLAFFGGLFDSDSDDLSDVPYLHANTDTSDRVFIGQGDNDNARYQHTFDSRSVSSINCLRWELDGVANNIHTNFYIYLAQDHLGGLWVFKYYINDLREFYVGSSSDDRFKAKLLSAFTDDNMYFRLINGQTDSDNIADPDNTVQLRDDDEQIIGTEQIIQFDASLSNKTYYDDDLVLVKCQTIQDANEVQWNYYHESTGLVLELWNRAVDSEESNYYDPDDFGMQADPAIDGWRLGWYGRQEPVFDHASADFSDVPFVKAGPGDLRVYRGQGNFSGSQYVATFDSLKMLSVNCLAMNETAVPQWNKPSSSLVAARDTHENLWLFKVVRNSLSLEEAAFIDQVTPFDLYPDMHMKLMTGDYAVGDTITRGDALSGEIEVLVSDDQELDNWPDLDDELVLVRWGEQADANNIDWTWYHESTGVVLDLWDNFYDPNLTDPNTENPDIIETDGDGWILGVPDELDHLRISVSACSDRQKSRDAFTLSGRWDGAAEDISFSELFLRVGPWQETVFLVQSGNKPVYKYKGTLQNGSYLSVTLDAKKGTFKVLARKTDLTGMVEPVNVEFTIGDYYGAGAASVINKQGVPLVLLKGDQDSLRSENYRYVSDDGPHNDSVTVSGSMTSSLGSIDLTDKKVTLSWGDDTAKTVNSNFIQTGKRARYVYRNKNATLTYALIDWDTARFKVVFKSAFIDAPTQDLNIEIKDSDDVVLFDQTVSVP